MKKTLIVQIAMITLILSFTACTIHDGSAQIPSTEAVLAGKIAGMYDNTFLVAGTGPADLYIVSMELDIYGKDNKAADTAALRAGQKIEIGYNGGIMESYPAQLGEPVYIKIIRQDDDLVGFYQSVLNDLWKKDKGLNPETGMLAFDMSQIKNMNEGEKSALVYTMSEAFGLTGMTGTFDELSEQGYINREQLYFENGILIRFELSDVTEDSFTFDVSKWRSGTGAYFFQDCKAVNSGGVWSYTVGSEAIS